MQTRLMTRPTGSQWTVSNNDVSSGDVKGSRCFVRLRQVAWAFTGWPAARAATPEAAPKAGMCSGDKQASDSRIAGAQAAAATALTTKLFTTPPQVTSSPTDHPPSPSQAISHNTTRGASQPVAMSTVIPSNPLAAPHLFQDPRLSPSRSGTSAQSLLQHPAHTTTPTTCASTGVGARHQANTHAADAFQHQTMSGRKRKADDELDNDRNNDRMSTSPTASPSIHHRALPAHRTIKRTRTHTSAGRPLPLPRLLQTLSADELRNLVQNICNERPDIRETIVTKAPRPSVESTLSVLTNYEHDLREAFPLGNRPTSDYAYNRVRQNLLQLIEALRDYTPYYLPPQETQTGLSLTYLDAVTNMIHRLPDWDTYQHQRHKNDAYDEIGRAWALVIKEAAKTAGGFRLQLGNWDQKLVEHNDKSGGRMAEAVSELQGAMGYMQAGPSVQATSQPSAMDQRAAIRQQLLSGTYGAPELGVGPGQW